MVTAVLVQWKRQHYLPEIIESIIKWPFISEILIRDNSKCENIMCSARYELAKKAKNDIIYSQDDDCIVRNLDEICEEFLKDPTTLTTGGIQGYLDVIDENIYGKKQMGMVGWGSFFKKEWVSVLDKYTKVYGKDKYYLRESDRIFSILLNKRHKILLADLKLFNTLEEDEQVALSEQKEHLHYKEVSIERALAL